MSFLTHEEERVIASLIEKEFTTPEYYPLTLNSLKNACNQKSNRDPVVEYSESDIEQVLESLFIKKMVFKVSGAEYRVPKYNENFTKYFELTKQEIAVMCLLMLRGPQTIGELRSRTGRLYYFENLADVEETLTKLMQRDGEFKFVEKLPRQSGRDARYVSVLAGEPDIDLIKPKQDIQQDKIDVLETEIANMKNEMRELKEEFVRFKKQFE